MITIYFDGRQHLTLASMLNRRAASACESGKWDPRPNFATVWFYGLVQVLTILWFSNPTSGNDGSDAITVKPPALRLPEHPPEAGTVHTCAHPYLCTHVHGMYTWCMHDTHMPPSQQPLAGYHKDAPRRCGATSGTRKLRQGHKPGSGQNPGLRSLTPGAPQARPSFAAQFPAVLP